MIATLSGASLSGAALAALLPLPVTVPAGLVDLHRRIIPDALNLALLVLGLAATAWRDGSGWAVVSAFAEAGLAFGLLWTLRALHARLRGRIGLGLGDVKFIAAATAWTGLSGLPVLILAASLSALAVVGIGLLAGYRIGRATRLPFAPFLALGLHVALFVGALA